MANSFKVGTAVVNLDAGTAEFTLKMAQAGATVKKFGTDGEASVNRVKAALHGVVPEQLAASAAIRSLEGNPGIRAAERFLTTTLGLRGALSAAFPVIGALAFADVLVTMADRAQKFYREVTQGSDRVKTSFASLNAETRVTNDQLAISNAQLENEIAKLTGKPQNGLKVALLETKQALDQVGESAEKALKNLHSLLQEESIGRINGFFTGRASTQDLKDPAQQLQFRIGDIQSKAQEKSEGLTKKEDIEATRRAANREIVQAIAQTEKEYKAELDKIAAERKQATDARAAVLKAQGYDKDPFPGVLEGQLKATENRRFQLQGALRNLRDIKNGVDLQDTNDDLKSKVAVAKANESNEKLSKPYDEAIARLKGKLAEVNTLIAAAGKSDADKAIAKGLGDAAKEAAKLNEELKKQGGLSRGQRFELDLLNVTIAQREAKEKILKLADDTIKKSGEEVAAQALLAAAIGKTYEEARAAAIQVELIRKLGDAVNSTDPQIVKRKADIASSVGAEYDAKHYTDTRKQIDADEKRTETQEALTKAVADGAGALRLQAEIEKEADIIRTQGVLGYAIAAAARAAFLAKEKTDSTERTKNLQQETADIRALAASYGAGADAIKDAQLKIEQAKIERNTPKGIDSAPEKEAAADRDRVARQAEVTKQAGAAVTHYQDQLDALQKELAAIQQIAVTDKNRIGIAIATKQIYDEQNKLIREQVLAVGSASDGAKQFLRDLVTENEAAAAKIHRIFTSAYEGINDQLSRLLTNQKTSFGQLFQSIGQQAVKQQLQQLEKLALGGLNGQLGTVIKDQIGKGGVLGTGVGGKGGGIIGLKRDGNTPATALYVTLADLNGISSSGGGAKPTAPPADSGLGKLLRIILGGGGGGASGPKIGAPDFFLPDSASSPSFSIPRSAGGGGGITQIINIDARDAVDPAATERRTRVAIEQSQAQAISASVQASREYQMRSPQ